MTTRKRSSDLDSVSNIFSKSEMPTLPFEKNPPTPSKAQKHKEIATQPTLLPPTPEPEEPQDSLKRDYAQERRSAMISTVNRITELKIDRESGLLGTEVIKLAQALILCTLPYRLTPDRQIVRSARLSDGSRLTVTFTAALDEVPMPYGADRDLMAWLFDKAIRSDTSFVPMKSANEYLQETSKSRSGANIRELAERLRRLSGLVIAINRSSQESYDTVILPMIAQAKLPPSLLSEEIRAKTGVTSSLARATSNQFGIQLEERLYRDIKEHHVAIPRELWLKLQSQKGGAVLKDLMIFFCYRCYCSQSETVIPWDALREQFPQDNSNPWRIKQNAKKAIEQLTTIWPEAEIEVVKQGIRVGRATAQLLPDDPAKKRVRRLK